MWSTACWWELAVAGEESPWRELWSTETGLKQLLFRLCVFNLLFSVTCSQWMNKEWTLNWSLLGISVGWRTGTCHFQCRYLKLENGRGADFCTSYHLGLLQLNNWEHWAGCSIENIGTLSWRLNWGHMNIGTPISGLGFSGPFMECTLDARGVLWAGGSIVNISTESWA